MANHLLPDHAVQQALEMAGEAYQRKIESFGANGWHLTRAPKGMNGIVYHAQHADGYDLAIKISKRDTRDRAGREYAATKALRESGHDICPRPLHLEREPAHLPGDVVISGWLPGHVLDRLPTSQDRAGWQAILDGMSQSHSLTPEASPIPLQKAVMDVREPQDVLCYIDGWLERLPRGKVGTLHHDQLKRLVERVHAITLPRWIEPAPVGLIQCDVNPNNILLHNGKIRLIDWENSGWADPAFDLADLFAKPDVGNQITESHRAWLRAELGKLLHDSSLPERSVIYERLLLVWWTLRISGYLVETSGYRLAGVQVVDREKTIAKQIALWQQSCTEFALNPA